MADSKPIFLTRVSDRFIKDVKGDDSKALLTVLSDKEADRVNVLIDKGSVFPAADNNGNPMPHQVNVRLERGASYDVTFQGPDGNMVRGTRTASELSSAYAKSQREYTERKGEKVFLNGVSTAMIREFTVPGKDGKPDRTLCSVSVADPESHPQPIKDAKGNPTGEFKETGYASFVVSPDAITPTKDGNDKKVNIYLGRENDKIRGYQIFTGEYGEDGKGIYSKVDRTAAEVKGQYEADIQEYKAKNRQAPSVPSEGGVADGHSEDQLGG